MDVKNVVILGSTGTIGINTLDVIRRFPKRFKVFGLSAYNNVKCLEQQVKEFRPAHVAVAGKQAVSFKKLLNKAGTKVWQAETDLSHIVSMPQVDIVVIGMSGSAALNPFLEAVRQGKTVAPANKEALVIAGDLLMKEARKYKATVIPIDSEQSAIFQCLAGQERAALKKVILTASGGALRKVSKAKFDRLTVAEILNHPRWRMGKKITVDSATLMNKGFEIIEAIRLFNLSPGDIEVIVHPEAIIHSMVSFKDGSILAQLSITDMRLPIQYALTYPQRLDTHLKDLDFIKLGQLNFEKPDLKKFPSLGLAMNIAKKGGTLPSVLNAADEVAVDLFLKGRLSFTGIYSLVEKVVGKHKMIKEPGLADIMAADTWARETTLGMVS